MDLSKIYQERPKWSHKGNYGSVLVVCGSKLYSGAATLAAVAALRSGADIVAVAAPKRAADIAANTLIDLITFPLKGDYLTSGHISEITTIAKIRRINSVVIGCGLGRHQRTIAAVHSLISKINIPMVLDADALWAISQKPQITSGKQAVLTPHAGELAILLGTDRLASHQGLLNFEARADAAKEAAIKYKSVVLLKGHIDIITDGVNVITNNAGDPRMTKGGFGDTLSGILGALLARGTGLIESAHVAAYINGTAGKMAVENFGESVVASDIFNYIKEVINPPLNPNV